MNHVRSMFLAVTFASSLAAGCDSSAKAAQGRVDEAQANADKAAAEAHADADETAQQAQVVADRRIADLQEGFAKTREAYRHEMQGNLDRLERRLSELDARSKAASGQRKVELDANISALRVVRDAFVADFKTLDAATPAAWDVTRARLDKSWADLKAAADGV